MAEDLEFGFDQDTPEGNDFKFISVSGKDDAIREGISLEELKVDKWDDGSVYLEVTVKDKEGKTCNRRYSQPKIDGTYVKDDAGLKKANEKFSKIAKNIATKILGDAVVLSGKTFEDFCNTLVTKVKSNANWNKIELRCVFVHDNNGYTKLRSFAPIFELAKIPKAESKLTISDYDTYTVKKTPNKEEDIPFNTENTSTEETKLFE